MPTFTTRCHYISMNQSFGFHSSRCLANMISSHHGDKERNKLARKGFFLFSLILSPHSTFTQLRQVFPFPCKKYKNVQPPK